MKTVVLIIVFFIPFRLTFGQSINNALIGKLLVDSDFEFIEILNDSLIYSSLNNFNDTATFEIENNKLTIIEYGYESPSVEKKYKFSYEIKKQSDSSLILISPNHFQLVFHDIKLLNNEINHFEYIELEYLTPWDNDRFIRIDSLGNYILKITYLPLKSRRFKRKHKTIKKHLSAEQIQEIEKKLVEYYAIYLPNERPCPIDGSQSNFVIKTNGKEIVSKGCCLGKIHGKLLHYLLTLKVK